MNWLKKLDNTWIGLLTGLLFPFIFFFLYWLFFHHQLGFPYRFVKYLMGGHLLSNVIKICALGNLLLFYGGLTYKVDRFSKGVVFSVIIYVALIAYITYYHEPEII
jgi:hypothetical protein